MTEYTLSDVLETIKVHATKLPVVLNDYYYNTSPERDHEYIAEIESFLIWNLSTDTYRFTLDILYEEILPRECLTDKDVSLLKMLFSRFSRLNLEEVLLDISLIEKHEGILNMIREQHFHDDIRLEKLIKNGRADCLKFMYHEHVKWDKKADLLFPLSANLRGSYPRMVRFFRENLENWINGIFPSNIKPCKK